MYVELGAGRGLLSYAVSCADPTSTVVLVERYGSKKKIDKALKEDLAELKASLNSQDTVSGAENSDSVAGAINRVRMDIRHCYLPLLPGVVAARDATADSTETTQSRTNKQQPVVVIAKHLCGVATDLAIQSVASFPHIPVSTEATKQGNHLHLLLLCSRQTNCDGNCSEKMYLLPTPSSFFCRESCTQSGYRYRHVLPSCMSFSGLHRYVIALFFQFRL